MGFGSTDSVSAKHILIGLSIALFTHMLIISACVWWWEVYKFNIDWKLHMYRPVPSFLFLYYAPSWFWVDLVISVIVFSSYATLLVLSILLAKALKIPKSQLITAVTIYTTLLLANWIWYEIFRANIKSGEKLNPSLDTVRYLLWGDTMYILTALLSFTTTLVFIARTALKKIGRGVQL